MALFALAEFLAAAGLLFFDEREKKQGFAFTLVALIMVNTFIMHNPLIEEGKNMHFAVKHFLLNVSIGFSLVMVAGFREY